MSCWKILSLSLSFNLFIYSCHQFHPWCTHGLVETREIKRIMLFSLSTHISDCARGLGWLHVLFVLTDKRAESEKRGERVLKRLVRLATHFIDHLQRVLVASENKATAASPVCIYFGVFLPLTPAGKQPLQSTRRILRVENFTSLSSIAISRQTGTFSIDFLWKVASAELKLLHFYER